MIIGVLNNIEIKYRIFSNFSFLKISSALLLLISDQIKRLIPIENIRRRIITVVMITIGIFIRLK